MTTAITKREKIILMKRGMTIWVDESRAEKLEGLLGGVTGHHFVKLGEEMINTAEIEGIYTPEQYEQIAKMKQGLWQCTYKKWHERKHECMCARDISAQARKQQERNQYETKPRTPEEDKSIKKALSDTRKHLEKIGVLK